jgi:hypothetical protein
MPGFHIVTHVPTLQQAQTIVREQSLFGTGKEVDVEALKVAEFVDNYCDSHITTKFPEDLSRLLIAAFQAGQNNISTVVEAGQKQRDMLANTKYIANQTDVIASAIYGQVAAPVSQMKRWMASVIAMLLLLWSGVFYIALVVSR